MTKKRKILFLIPFCIVTGTILYSLGVYFAGESNLFIRHYIGIALYLPLIYFLLKEKNYKKTLVCLGIYLLLATFNAIFLFPGFTYNYVGLNLASVEIKTPPFNLHSFLIFVLYAILNFDSLTDIYLDYKESKGKL